MKIAILSLLARPRAKIAVSLLSSLQINNSIAYFVKGCFGHLINKELKLQMHISCNIVSQKRKYGATMYGSYDLHQKWPKKTVEIP